MSVKIKKSTAIASLSITPLIDVVFLLLIFFLVATRFAEEDYELQVSLPNASTAMPMNAPPKQLIVNIDREGTYFVGNTKMAADEVEAVIQREVADNPIVQQVDIRADRRVQFDAVVKVIDICNKAGARHTVSTEGQ